jgi:hypothetical protein
MMADAAGMTPRVLPDPVTYVATLRRGVRFHDGHELTDECRHRPTSPCGHPPASRRRLHLPEGCLPHTA